LPLSGSIDTSAFRSLFVTVPEFSDSVNNREYRRKSVSESVTVSILT